MSGRIEGAGAIAHASPAGPRVVCVEDLEAPFHLGEGERTDYLRRFSTLFVDEASARRGGLGRVLRAANALGERVAIKTLVLPDGVGERDERALREAFRREYECQRSLASLRGFPRAYAYGRVEGMPAIVMEWVEGVTLAEARRRLAVDDEGRVSPLAVARIGSGVFELVSRLALVGGGMAHRDVSPANVMVRTSARTLEEQRADGSFDLCLVDFGSAEPLGAGDGSFTSSRGSLRRATPDYAPPEMLSDDIPSVERLRHSAAVDVYAAASVLCELLGGSVPHPGAAEAASPYRHKVDNPPLRPVPAHAATRDLAAVLAREGEVAVIVAPMALERELAPRDEGLRRALSLTDEQIADALMACLAVDQHRRPAPELMRDELDGLARRYGDNVRRAMGGMPLTPCMTDGPWLGVEPPLSPRRLLRASGRVVGALACASAAAATAWLAGGGSPGPVAAVAALLVLPALLALLVRWRDTASGAGLARGTATLVLGSLASGLALWGPMGMGVRLPGALAALCVCASAAWLALVVDYTCAFVPPLVREGRRRLPEAATCGEGDDAPAEPALAADGEAAHPRLDAGDDGSQAESGLGTAAEGVLPEGAPEAARDPEDGPEQAPEAGPGAEDGPDLASEPEDGPTTP